jgi:hypothetical protein
MRLAALAALLTLLGGCPAPLPAGSDGGLDGGATGDAGFCPTPPAYTENVASCVAGPDDYRPRVAMSANDTWPACVSDSNVYSPINPSITTVARVAAFEQIADRLWRGQRVPGPQDFVDARVQYALDQGLDSRVQRREDVHYPAAPMPCSTAGIPDQHPDRCVGPAKLLPILNDAFTRGAMGERPQVHAARIEAALTWFLYVSALSEVMTCTTRAQDCDSCWAYYSGGTARDAPLGLAKAIATFAPETHQRAWDGTLAVRCWRNLDNETGTATNLALRDRAFAQLDTAMLRGMAVVLRQRVAELACTSGEAREARLAFAKVLAPLLDRALRERGASQAAVVAAELGKSDPAQVDVAAVTGALDVAFPCP